MHWAGGTDSGCRVSGVAGYIDNLAFLKSKGLPPVNAPKEKKVMSALETTEFNRAQKAVLRSPAIWILALSSAFMYISRYAVNSWGIFYLEAQKGYSTLDAISLSLSVRYAAL